MNSKIVYKLKVQKPISFLVVGIASHEKIFMVSNELNRLFNITLDRLQTIDILKGNTSSLFNAYSNKPDENKLLFSVLSNRGNEGVLFEKYRTLDYFFIISGETQPTLEDVCMGTLKKSKLFLATTHLDKIPTKETKIFEGIVNQLWS